jgi:hypothetical protein
MNPANRSSILLAIMMLFLIMLPVMSGVIGLIEDNELADEDDLFTADSLLVARARLSIHQLLPGLVFGMSIFTLFVVYLGGRSNHRRFNDRTIDAINSLRGTLFATALLRAVFVFLFPVLSPIRTNTQSHTSLIPTIISVPKEVL